MTSSRSRSQSQFDKLVQASPIGQPLGHNIESPETVLRMLLTEYNKQNLSKEELSNEINMLLRANPEHLGYFRSECYKNKLNIALKNNYMDNSPYYTIKPEQKKGITRRKIASNRKPTGKSRSTGKSSKRGRKTK